MGCFNSKNSPPKDEKGNKLSYLRPKVIAINIKRKVMEVNRKIKRNLFFVIQRKDWIVVLDFLPYKDLCQAGQLNKFLNNVAKSQHVLKKFFKNKGNNSNNKSSIYMGSSRPTSTHSPLRSYINNSQNVTNHYNFTTINNYNNSPNLPSKNANISYQSQSSSIYKSKGKNELFINDNKNGLSIPQFMSSEPIDKVNLDKINETFKTKLDLLDSPISSLSKKGLYNVPTFKNSDRDLESLINPSFSSINISNFTSNSNIYNNMNSNNNMASTTSNGVKLYITKVNSPYVDMFSKKEIDIKSEKESKDNESLETYKIFSSRKHSLDDYMTEKTPSFSQEVLMTLDEGKISITNITQINFSVNKSVTTSSRENKSKNLTTNISNDNYLRVPHKRITRFNSAGSSYGKNLIPLPAIVNYSENKDL